MKAIERVKEYIELKGFNNSSFEKHNSLSNGYIGTQLKRKADMGEGIIIKILDTCSDINMVWLMRGEGPMLKDSVDNKEVTYISNDVLDRFEEQPEVYRTTSRKNTIPLIPIEAMATYGTEEARYNEYVSEMFTIPAFKDADFLIQVNDSAMVPKYNAGDIVACKKLSRDQILFQWNKVYVLDTSQGALINRIDKGEDDDHVMIVSDNEENESFQLPKSKINAIAIVVGSIHLD
ncbi:hypothetical protein B4N84_16295 [Flavobacterium sp. IR1]|nr:hypothetical protein B4N84_16295 [Flavobacterium sp. IR1]